MSLAWLLNGGQYDIGVRVFRKATIEEDFAMQSERVSAVYSSYSICRCLSFKLFVLLYFCSLFLWYTKFRSERWLSANKRAIFLVNEQAIE